MYFHPSDGLPETLILAVPENQLRRSSHGLHSPTTIFVVAVVAGLVIEKPTLRAENVYVFAEEVFSACKSEHVVAYVGASGEIRGHAVYDESVSAFGDDLRYDVRDGRVDSQACLYG